MSTPDYLSEVKPLEDAGQTDEQIAAELGLRHVRDVWATNVPGQDSPDLLHIISARMRVIRRGDNGFIGPLPSYFSTVDGSSPADQQQLKQGYEMLLGVLQIAGRKVFCGSHGPTGQLVTGITEVVKSLVDADPTNPYTSATVQAEMDEFTGGIKYPGLVAADVAQSRSDYQAQQAANTRRQAVLSARTSHARPRVEAALAAFDSYYQSADYSVDTDHEAAAIQAFVDAFTNWTP